ILPKNARFALAGPRRSASEMSRASSALRFSRSSGRLGGFGAAPAPAWEAPGSPGLPGGGGSSTFPPGPRRSGGTTLPSWMTFTCGPRAAGSGVRRPDRGGGGGGGGPGWGGGGAAPPGGRDGGDLELPRLRIAPAVDLRERAGAQHAG